MQNKISGHQFPSEWVQGGWGICAGAPGFHSLALDVKTFCVCFTAGQCLLSFSPNLPPPPPLSLWLEGKCGKYPMFSLFFQCDSVWWLPLIGLSWLPYALGLVCSWAPPSFPEGNIPQAHHLLMSLTRLHAPRPIPPLGGSASPDCCHSG